MFFQVISLYIFNHSINGSAIKQEKKKEDLQIKKLFKSFPKR
jgi:hypothetical protein